MAERVPVLPSLAEADTPAAVLSSACASGSALVAVTGLPSAGKSVWTQQLIAVAQSPVTPVRWRVVAVTADEPQRDVPFALADRLLRAAGGSRRSTGSKPPDGALAAQSDLQVSARALRTALRRGVSSRRRLLLVVDDAQWVDEESARVLRLALRAIPAASVVVLAGQDPQTTTLAESVRAADPEAWQLWRPVRIEPLDAAGVRRYVSVVHGVEVSLGLAQRIGDAAEGSPLLVDQVVAHMEPVWAARAAATPERRARFDEDVTATDIARRFSRDNPFAKLESDLSAPALLAVQIVTLLGGAITAGQLDAVAARLEEHVDAAGALAAGFLMATGDPATTKAAEVELRPFNHLYATDLAARVPGDLSAAILTAAALVLPGEDVAGRHRALLWQLRALEALGGSPTPDLQARVRAHVADAAEARLTEQVFEAMQLTLRLTDPHDPQSADALVLALYSLSTALSTLPRMIEWIPRLEAMPSTPLRDLALLHVREFRGDYEWSESFAAELLQRLPDVPSIPVDPAELDALTPETVTGLVVRMHTLLLLGLMAPQARRGDYGLEHLARAREAAGFLIEAQAERPEVRAVVEGRGADPRLGHLPSPHDVVLRAIGMTLFGVSAQGRVDRAREEVAALSQAIATTPVDTPTVFDAHLIRAGVFSAIGFIGMAAEDLATCMSMLRAGTGGWGTGTAWAMHLYCQYLLGNTEEVTAAMDEAEVTILDNMDAVGRPVFYALQAAIRAASGDEAGWQSSMDAAHQATATSYDTIGVEYEMLAHIALARLRRDPAAQLAVFDPDGPFSGRLLRSQNLYAYKVDALAALGRAEEADRELARLKAIPAPGFQPVYGSIEWLEGRVHEAYGLTSHALRAYRAAADPNGPGERLPAVIAQAALDTGRLLIATGGSRQIARRYLRTAQHTFARLGRGPALTRATELIDALQRTTPPVTPTTGTSRQGGASGRRAGAESVATPPVTSSIAGYETLTAREREVAVLAARGRTNAEIAAELNITVSGAGFHMSRILAKLGLASRRQLRGAGVGAGAGAEPTPDQIEPAAVPSGWEVLTRREREVAALAARELTDAEIADELGVGIRGINFHMRNVLAKLGLASRRELHERW